LIPKVDESINSVRPDVTAVWQQLKASLS
jgi:hypothetical protein